MKIIDFPKVQIGFGTGKTTWQVFTFCLILGLNISFSLPVLSQNLPNSDFEQLCDSSSSGFCHWKVSWGKDSTCRPAISTFNHCLSINGAKKTSVGFAENQISLDTSSGLRVVKLSGKIKSQEVQGKGAGLNLAFYDQEGNFLSNKNMGYGSFAYVKNTNDWKNYEIASVCPDKTASLKIGAILYGKGTAYFDDFSLSVMKADNQTTDSSAIRYIHSACDIIKKNSIVRDSIDFNLLQKQALKICGNPATDQEKHLSVEYMITALRKAGDPHSFLIYPDEWKLWKNDSSENANIDFPKYKVVSHCGYILIPHFDGGNEKLIRAFIDSIHHALNYLQDQNIVGWIIDLRENTGGNMKPMIAGLGPLFTGEKLGSLYNVEGKKQSWHFSNDRFFWDDDDEKLIVAPLDLRKQIPIAVLTGNKTGSSGEIVAISFIGNKNTRSFGQPTWGLTTGNGSFTLEDSAVLQLASTFMADRNGKIYKGPIPPDELVEAKAGADFELLSAVKWLENKK